MKAYIDDATDSATQDRLDKLITLVNKVSSQRADPCEAPSSFL
jgi:hypothetical protein